MKPLETSDLYRIVDTVPSISDRAKLLSHLVVTGSCAPARITRSEPAAPDPQKTSEAIGDWARSRWKESSVRAKTVATLIKAIQSGEVELL